MGRSRSSAFKPRKGLAPKCRPLLSSHVCVQVTLRTSSRVVLPSRSFSGSSPPLNFKGGNLIDYAAGLTLPVLAKFS